MMLTDESAPPLTPFIEQCDTDGIRQTWARPVWHSTRCGYCAKPVSYFDGFLEIVSDYENRVTYPQAEFGARCVLSHAKCGPDVGFHIAFTRLRDDPTWEGHLEQKKWFNEEIGACLVIARRTAAACSSAVNAGAPAAAPVVPAKAQVRAPAKLRRPHLRIVNNPRSITPSRRARIMERDGFKCRRCGCGPDDAPLVVDHIIPVAKGGTRDDDNLQTLCRPCNAGKSDRDPHEHDRLPLLPLLPLPARVTPST